MEGLHIQTNTIEPEGENTDTQDQLGGSRLKFNRDLSWDLEAEFARVQAMDLQQRLQMEQLKKERTVLDSVKRDLQRFQETLQTNGSSSASGTNTERPVRQRESLLPPPLTPRKKSKPTQSKASKKNEQQKKVQLMSSNLSTGEPEGAENTDISESEMVDDGSTHSELQLELGDQLPDDDSESNSVNVSALEEGYGEGDGIDIAMDHSEIATDAYPAIPDVIEEESDGYLSGSDAEENVHSDTEEQQLSLTSLANKTEPFSKSELEQESTDQISDRAKSSRNDSMQEQRTSTLQRANTRGGSRPVSNLVSMESSSRNIGTSGLGSGTTSTSRGMRGSALSKSQRGKRNNSSEFKGANIGEVSNNCKVGFKFLCMIVILLQDMGPLSVSRPQTVQQIDTELREQNNSSGQRSCLPTRERSRRSSQAQITVADPTQVLAHRKSELAKQQLIEAQKKEALLEQEREMKRQEKKLRQAEFEDRMSAALKNEESEIRRQRKLKAEVIIALHHN